MYTRLRAQGILDVEFQPANSPDLSPLDWWYWSSLKKAVYTQRGPLAADGSPPWGNDVAQLKVAIFQTFDEKLEEAFAVLPALATSFYKRLKACARARGGHFELS